MTRAQCSRSPGPRITQAAHFKRAARMTELSYQHKQTLGETRHVVDENTFFDDIVPAAVTDIIRAFAAEFSPLPPIHVPLCEELRPSTDGRRMASAKRSAPTAVRSGSGGGCANGPASC